jgi:hypothetical protein
MLKKKIWANFQRIIELFTQKIFTKLSKIWVWDQRFGIRKKPIPDSGSRGQKGTGSRIRIRNTEKNLVESWFVSGSTTLKISWSICFLFQVTAKLIKRSRPPIQAPAVSGKLFFVF